MALLLVEDRDGRVSIPDYICLVEPRSHHGAIFGSDTSIKIRPLSNE